MRLKFSVKYNYAFQAIADANTIANDVYRQFGYNMTKTSVDDSKHGPTTLHGKGLAFDIRTKDLKPGDGQKITQEIISCLTQDFDVIFEGDHIHIEYDKK